MQGIGILTASLVAIVTTAAFKPLILKDIKYLDYVWRIELGLGVVPALLTVYLRNKLPEPPQWTLVSREKKMEREGKRDERGKEREKSENHFFLSLSLFSHSKKNKQPPLIKTEKKGRRRRRRGRSEGRRRRRRHGRGRRGQGGQGGGAEAPGARIPLNDNAELAAAGGAPAAVSSSPRRKDSSTRATPSASRNT